MKFTLGTDGEISIEATNGDAKEALGLLLGLRAEKVREEAKKEISENRSEASKMANEKDVEGSGLNGVRYRTWSYVLDNEVAGGIHVSQVAHAFGIDTGAANGRLITLLKMGYAERLAKGYYRAVQP